MRLSNMHIHEVHEIEICEPENYAEDSPRLGQYQVIRLKGARGEQSTIIVHFYNRD